MKAFPIVARFLCSFLLQFLCTCHFPLTNTYCSKSTLESLSTAFTSIRFRAHSCFLWKFSQVRWIRWEHTHPHTVTHSKPKNINSDKMELKMSIRDSLSHAMSHLYIFFHLCAITTIHPTAGFLLFFIFSRVGFFHSFKGNPIARSS